MPLVILTDNGSTEEDEASYKIASVYDIPFVVIDHHHPDATIDKYLVGHVNPYHVGRGFRGHGRDARDRSRPVHQPPRRTRHPAPAGGCRCR